MNNNCDHEIIDSEFGASHSQIDTCTGVGDAIPVLDAHKIMAISEGEFGLAMDEDIVHDELDSVIRTLQKECTADDRARGVLVRTTPLPATITHGQHKCRTGYVVFDLYVREWRREYGKYKFAPRTALAVYELGEVNKALFSEDKDMAEKLGWGNTKAPEILKVLQG